jgi:hypothetical protein
VKSASIRLRVRRVKIVARENGFRGLINAPIVEF